MKMKTKIKMVCLILTVVGGIIAYLAVFKDAFGGASGFLAVVGVAIFACGFCPLFGISGEDIEENQKKHIDRLEIEKLNHEWNNAQRKYDRYNGKRK